MSKQMIGMIAIVLGLCVAAWLAIGAIIDANPQPTREYARLVAALDGLCTTHKRAILYVGDTTVIDGRFLECGTDFGVVVGMQAPEKLAQRYWVSYGSVKMVREVVESAKQ